MEPITIVVMPRDRFSTMETCLDNIFENTPEPFDLWVLSGGAPERLEKKWQERYAGKVAFTFFPHFKNGAALRNYAFEKLKTRLAAFIDSDVFVRPGWLPPLIRSQQETGAALISPLVLDRDDRVHTAGNEFLIINKDGQEYAIMEQRYGGHRVDGTTNLVRRETDFCEMHCHLVLVEAGKKIAMFDENLREFQEMDCGLTLKKHGYSWMIEPQSTVYLYYEQLLTHPEDIPLHIWKWDMTAMRDGFNYFKNKWGMDINPANYFEDYLLAVNRRVGFFSRHWPSPLSVGLDKVRSRGRKWWPAGR